MRAQNVPVLFGDRYDVLERAAIRAAKRNGCSLWYIPRTFAGVYTDSAGTLPAAVGTPVGYVKDAGSGLYNATQPTSGNKPTIELVDGRSPAIKFDGTDDYLTTSFVLTTSGSVEAGTAYELVATTTHLMGSVPGTTDMGFLLDVDSGNARMTVWENGANSDAATLSLASATRVVQSGVGETGQPSLVRVRGVSATVGSVVQTGTTVLDLGRTPSNFGRSQSRHVMFWCAPVRLPSADRQAIEAFGAHMLGIAYAV